MNIPPILRAKPDLVLASPVDSNARGFSLLEVLVALLVLSIGLLGLAALQSIGLRFTHQSYERTQAVLLASEIIDRMRANSAGLDHYTPTAVGANPNAAVNCSTTSCTSAEMATYDISEWLNRIRDPNFLAGGAGVICRGTLNASLACTEGGSIFRVGVSWLENDLTMQLIVEAGI